MKNILRLFLLFTLVSTACAEKRPDKIVASGEFPISLTPQVVELKEIEVICPEDLIVHNGYMVILNNCHNKILQLVSLRDMQSRFFANKGRGPSELYNVFFSGQKAGDSLLLMHAPAYYVWINPEKAFNDHTYQIDRSQGVYIPPQNMNVFQVSGNWFYNDMEGHGFMVSRNKEGSLLFSGEFYPQSPYASDRNRGYVYYAWTRYCSARETFVSALRYFPYVIFTDIDGRITRVLQTRQSFHEPVFAPESLLPQDGTKIFNLGIQISDKYIFNYNPGLSTGESQLNASPVIEVYDWEGNPVLKLQLNALVGAVDYCFESGRIFGLKYSPDEMRLSIAEIIVPDSYRDIFTK